MGKIFYEHPRKAAREKQDTKGRPPHPQYFNVGVRSLQVGRVRQTGHKNGKRAQPNIETKGVRGKVLHSVCAPWLRTAVGFDFSIGFLFVFPVLFPIDGILGGYKLVEKTL